MNKLLCLVVQRIGPEMYRRLEFTGIKLKDLVFQAIVQEYTLLKKIKHERIVSWSVSGYFSL